ncbi:MAG: Na+/H+ antiporter subunit E [Desulfotomaculales bacterium]
MSFWLTAVTMFSFWILLSGHFDPLLLLLGVVSSLLVARWSHDLLLSEVNVQRGARRIWRFIKYCPWLLWQIVLANLNLLYLTLHPKMPISPRVITFDSGLKTEVAIVILANSITLTPGTVTVEGTREEFVVHAIDSASAEGLLKGVMQARVKHIED